jgi:hypothetical protein
MPSLFSEIVLGLRILVRNSTWVAACLAVLADVLSTFAVLDAGGREANPLIADMVNANPDSLWVLGLGQIALFAGFGWYFLVRRDPLRYHLNGGQLAIWFTFAGIAWVRFSVAAANMDVYRQLTGAG